MKIEEMVGQTVFYSWNEASGGEQLFSRFDTAEAAQAHADEHYGAMVPSTDFNSDELTLLDWLFANPNPLDAYETSYDAHEDRKEVKHLGLNTRKLKHFKLCAFSDAGY